MDHTHPLARKFTRLTFEAAHRSANLFAHSGAHLSTPPERRGHMGQNRLQHMYVVGNAQLVRDGQEESVGFGNRIVFSELFNEHIGLGGIAPAKNGTGIIDVTDLISFLRPPPEVSAVAIIGQREDAAADRDAWCSGMARLFPCSTESAYLRGLLHVEWLTTLIKLEG